MSKETTSNIVWTISENTDRVNCSIKVRLNDECKNGREDFSITGTFWQIGKVRTDTYFTHAGSCHDEILKFFPDLKIFVDLHLCRFDGVPMYAVPNILFHIRDGKDTAWIMKTYNIPESLVDIKSMNETIMIAEDEIVLTWYLFEFGIIGHWKKLADEAIARLETETGLKFVSNATKFKQVYNLDEDTTKMIDERFKSGYYNPDKVAYRKLDKKFRDYIDNQVESIMRDLHESNKESIRSAHRKIINMVSFLFNGGKNYENFIIYSDDRVVFNWSSGDKINEAQFEAIVDRLKKFTGFTDYKYQLKK